jgi:uncharacterized membrane protein YhiD involved in acid resistance
MTDIELILILLSLIIILMFMLAWAFIRQPQKLLQKLDRKTDEMYALQIKEHIKKSAIEVRSEMPIVHENVHKEDARNKEEMMLMAEIEELKRQPVS